MISLKKFILYIYHKYKNRNFVLFDRSVYLSHRCQFEGMNRVGSHSHFYGTMGLGSYIGGECHISADVGKFSSLGNRISQIVETHTIKTPYATTSPLFTSLKKQVGYTFATRQIAEEYRYYDKEREIAFKIGNDCWIGNEVCFIGGVHVGDGAVVLSRAIVTKDVPPYAIVGGVPAKVIGYRYDEETVRFLLKIRWWENDEQWFKANWELMSDIDRLKEYYSAK